MANYIGACGYCGASCDRDDPDFIVLTGETYGGRLHVVLCSLGHLKEWAGIESAVRSRQRHVREHAEKHPLPGMLCDTCPDYRSVESQT
jgi:hypothetical protein